MGEIVNLVIRPLGLGLRGFIEPCSIGSSRLFIKCIEGKDRRTKAAQADRIRGDAGAPVCGAEAPASRV